MGYICGITNIGSKTVSFERLYAMSRSMAGRGGERTGGYINRGVGLACGFTRTAFEHNEPNEPYTMIRAGRTYTVVLDGEIYNLRELAGIMGRADFSCTAEAVLEAYVSFGYDCASMLNGIFSFAVYDERAGEVYLARDALGAKPLYYHRDGAVIAFSSEIKGILRYMRGGIEVEREALGELLRTADTSIDGAVLYRTADELQASSYAVCSALGVSVREYKGRSDKILERWCARDTIALGEPPEEYDIQAVMGEMVAVFDHPRFDEYSISYLNTLTKLRESGVRRAVIEDPAIANSRSHALERADRLGSARGISLGIAEPSAEREMKRRTLAIQEKKLAREADILLSESGAYLPRFFGGDILVRIQDERDIRVRIRMLGIAIQSELWLRRYPLMLV